MFTSGVLWESGAQDEGVIYPSGTTMPDAVSPASASGYTLVIKDTVREGGDPPSQEFLSTDGPNGSSSLPESFFTARSSRRTYGASGNRRARRAAAVTYAAARLSLE